MSTGPSAALAAVMAAEQKSRTAADYGEPTAKAQELRDVEKEIIDLKERLVEKNKRANELRFKELPDAMQAIGIDTLGLPAEGNLPGYDIKMRPYYHASIPAEWSIERKIEAHEWLEAHGHGDLLKMDVTVHFGRREADQARELESKLAAMGLQPEVEASVHWKTYTAWAQEQVEKYHREYPWDKLGVQIGYVVKLTPRKD